MQLTQQYDILIKNTFLELGRKIHNVTAHLKKASYLYNTIDPAHSNRKFCFLMTMC